MSAYAETLRRFARIAAEDGFAKDVAAIESVHLYAYLGRYTNHPMETRHRYSREGALLFNWLVAAGYLEETQFRALRNVRLPQRIVRAVLPGRSSSAPRLLQSEGMPSEPATRRSFSPLLDTGIRCSEIVQLNLEDLDLDEGRLRVLHAKGNR